jgi:hypothetical protein
MCIEGRRVRGNLTGGLQGCCEIAWLPKGFPFLLFFLLIFGLCFLCFPHCVFLICIRVIHQTLLQFDILVHRVLHASAAQGKHSGATPRLCTLQQWRLEIGILLTHGYDSVLICTVQPSYRNIPLCMYESFASLYLLTPWRYSSCRTLAVSHILCEVS